MCLCVYVFVCRWFEKVCLYCEKFSAYIPVAFVLGFYVQVVVGRWFEQVSLFSLLHGQLLFHIGLIFSHSLTFSLLSLRSLLSLLSTKD